MQSYTQQQIEHLIQRFEQQQLPKAEWTHAAHLVVAIWYTSKYSEEESLHLVRQYIIQHNESVGTINSETSGYHETITRFWLRTARQFIATHTFGHSTVAINAFIQSKYGKSDWILNYYTKERLFSVEARLSFID